MSNKHLLRYFFLYEVIAMSILFAYVFMVDGNIEMNKTLTQIKVDITALSFFIALFTIGIIQLIPENLRK